jgi:hypothetical protein
LFHTREEAGAFIHDLIYGGSGFKAFYGGRQELACNASAMP